MADLFFLKEAASDYARISNELQRLSETPLLISADFERGTGMRVTDGVLFPNNMAIGATRNYELAYKMGFEIRSHANPEHSVSNRTMPPYATLTITPGSPLSMSGLSARPGTCFRNV